MCYCFFPLYFYCIQVLNSQRSISFFKMHFAHCAQQTFLQLHDLSIVFSVNFDCEILCFVKCWSVVCMLLSIRKCPYVLWSVVLFWASGPSYFWAKYLWILTYRKKVEASGEVEHSERKKGTWLLLPTSTWNWVRVMLRARVRFATGKGVFCVILTSCSPERTSRRRISMRPSRRSVYKSPMRQVTRPKWEFTHLVKVFFCTASRSSAKETMDTEDTENVKQQ